MKKTNITSLAILLALSSCKDDLYLTEKTANSPCDSNEYISFTFDGNPYSYTGCQVGEVNEPTTSWLTRIQTNGNASHFELHLSDTIVGSYTLSSDTYIQFGSLYNGTGSTPLKATVTRYDTIGGFIEGTFEGTVKRTFSNETTTYEFTNGSFRVIRDHKSS